jgi:hypothetical protein
MKSASREKRTTFRVFVFPGCVRLGTMENLLARKYTAQETVVVSDMEMRSRDA